MPAPIQPRLLRKFTHDAPLSCCAFAPGGRFLLAGGRSRQVQCIDTQSGETARIGGHRSWVSAMATAPWGTRLFTADYVGQLICWACDGGRPTLSWRIAAHRETIRTVAVSRDGRQVATAGRDGVIRIWDAKDGRHVAQLSGHAGQVYAVLFHPDGKHLVSADRAPQSPGLKQWELATQREIRRIDASDVSAYRRGENIEWGGVRGLAISPDGSLLACCGRHKYAGPCCVLLFDWADGKQQNKLLSTMKGVCSAVVFHPDGFLLAAGADVAAGELRCWHPAQPEESFVAATQGPCWALDLHPDGRRIAAAESIGEKTYPEEGAVELFELRRAPPS